MLGETPLEESFSVAWEHDTKAADKTQAENEILMRTKSQWPLIEGMKTTRDSRPIEDVINGEIDQRGN